MAECGDPAPYLRLLRRQHPRIARSATTTACSSPAHREVQPTLDNSFAPPPPMLSNLGSVSEKCPHCTRVFSKDAAERHVPICAQLRSRPKPPVKEMAETFTDTLGRRHRSRPGTANSCKTPSASPMNVSTPSRCRANRQGTPSGSRRLDMGSEGSEQATVNLANNSKGTSSLSDQWMLLQFLLRDGLEALWDDASISSTLSKAEECLVFLEKLEDWANRLKMRKGALSRMILPFDAETNSNDQAQSASELGSQELNGLIPTEERRKLVAQAVALRRLIRVKVADCNDVEQAREALRLTASFLNELKRKGVEEHRTMTSLLREL